ncbi:MAG TPA: precorrin-6y C5,15-methyltransferase (decarboxylating) subunit CbiE [Syntrophaceae bacterium]|nr:precorrin-6y C5,15-methyltransferase (decarboxylating) subunit CbiE [Syntrophaceae bacterium]HCX01469.1 precorrin-6y C5,15-methyltransferase (decarboxylating) subunit CbiE [Syntrophaceae bacterium]
MDVIFSRPMIIAGCGPGSPDYLTEAVRKAVEQADVLVGAKRLLALFPESSAERIIAGVDVEIVLQAISLCHASKRIVVLVTGDPGASSLAQPVIRRFGRAACLLIPGVSSVQAAFARIGVDWIGSRVISAHGRQPVVEPESLQGEDRIAVLGGGRTDSLWVSHLADILGTGYAIFVCADLTLPNERVCRITRRELAADPASSRTIYLFVKEAFLA